MLRFLVAALLCVATVPASAEYMRLFGAGWWHQCLLEEKGQRCAAAQHLADQGYWLRVRVEPDSAGVAILMDVPPTAKIPRSISSSAKDPSVQLAMDRTWEGLLYFKAEACVASSCRLVWKLKKADFDKLLNYPQFRIIYSIGVEQSIAFYVPLDGLREALKALPTQSAAR
jgi:invasion protein IalB